MTQLIKSKFVLFCGLACLACMVNSQETPKRANLKPRIGGRTNQFSKTTTSAPPPAEYDEYAEEGEAQQDGEPAELEESEPAKPAEDTTTTEAPKKLNPSLLRPFRSNDDLLSALKRRQQNSKTNKPAPKAYKPKDDEQKVDGTEETESAPAPVAPAKPAIGGRRRFGAPKSTNVAAPPQEQQVQTIDESSDDAAPPAPGKRLGRGRFSLPSRN